VSIPKSGVVNGGLPAKESPKSIIVVDDQPIQIGYFMDKLEDSGYEVLLIDSAARRDKVLAGLDPSAPPCLAMIDLSMDVGQGKTGLEFLSAILKHDVGRNVTPVLASNMPTLPPFELQAVLCAHAAAGGDGTGGVLMAPKTPDFSARFIELARLIETHRQVGGVGRYHVDAPLQEFRLIRPIVLDSVRRRGRVDLVQVLLGTPALRELWGRYAAHADINQVVIELRNKYHSGAEDAVNRYLEPLGDRSRDREEWAPAAGNAGSDFVARSDVGALARVWRAKGDTFVDFPTVVHPDDAENVRRPAQAFDSFASKYASLLSRQEVHQFAVDYLAGALRTHTCPQY